MSSFFFVIKDFSAACEFHLLNIVERKNNFFEHLILHNYLELLFRSHVIFSNNIYQENQAKKIIKDRNDQMIYKDILL